MKPQTNASGPRSLALSEEELGAKTAFFEAQAESSIDGILVVDSEDRKIFQNHRLVDLFNIPEHIAEDKDDEKQRRWVMDLMKNPDQFIEKVAYLYSHPDEISREELELKSGMILDRQSSPVFGKEGSYYGRIWTFRDITERRQGERALIASEIRYRRLFESAKDGILILEAETGIVVDVNPYLSELLGYAKDSMLGKSIWELGFIKDIIASKANFAELKQKEYIRYDDKPLEASDGRKVDVEFVSNVYLVQNVKVIQCNIRDITERKEAEGRVQKATVALRESAEKFRAMFEVASIGMSLSDPDTGQRLRVNSKLCKITGYSEEELLKTRISDIAHPEERQKEWESYQRVVRGEVPDYRAEKRFVRKDGEVVWVNVNGTVIRDTGGKPVCTMATIEDITERKQTEQRIAQLNRLKAILSGVNSAIIHIPEQEKLLDEICRISIEEGLFKLAWIGKVSPDGSVQVASKAGLTAYLDGISIVTRDEPAGRGGTGTAIRENRVVVIEDTLQDAGMAPWHARVRQFGLSYIAAFPLHVAGKVWGSFQAYAPHPNFFDEN